MNNIIFTPMFKTKANSEKPVLKIFSEFFNDKIIPFIEFIRSPECKIEKAIVESLKEKVFFAQMYKSIKNAEKKVIPNNSLDDQIGGIDLLMQTSELAIPVLYLEKEAISNEKQVLAIKKTIDNVHSKKRKLGIRYFGDIEDIASNNPIKEINYIIDFLNKDDYFFYDTGDDYDARLFDKMRLKREYIGKVKIILLSCERKHRLNSKKEFPEYDFARACFTTSLLKDVLNGKMEFDGFGTYCGLEDSLTEEQSHSYQVYGLLLIYDIKNNLFFSIRTNKPDWNSAACKPLKGIISKKWSLELKPNFFDGKTNEFSLKDINDLLSKEEKSGNHSTYIKIGLEKYLEEVINYIS